MIRTHLKSDGESLSPVSLENGCRPDQTRFDERGDFVLAKRSSVSINGKPGTCQKGEDG